MILGGEGDGGLDVGIRLNPGTELIVGPFRGQVSLLDGGGVLEVARGNIILDIVSGVEALVLILSPVLLLVGLLVLIARSQVVVGIITSVHTFVIGMVRVLIVVVGVFLSPVLNLASLRLAVAGLNRVLSVVLGSNMIIIMDSGVVHLLGGGLDALGGGSGGVFFSEFTSGGDLSGGASRGPLAIVVIALNCIIMSGGTFGGTLGSSSTILSSNGLGLF